MACATSSTSFLFGFSNFVPGDAKKNISMVLLNVMSLGKTASSFFYKEKDLSTNREMMACSTR